MTTGQSARETAAYWREQHMAGNVPEYEDILRDGFQKFIRPGDIVVDIGVNQGLHFARFQKLVGASGRVIGFEPVPDLVVGSKEVCGQDAEIRQKALSEQPGQGEFLYMSKAIGESGFKERTSEADRGATPIQVEISTLDHELADIEKLRYIKIDTEGHEISILKGGRATIARLRPIISVEWGEPTYSLYGHEKGALYALATEMDYRVSDLFGNLVESADEWDAISDQSYWDFFLVPSEITERWSRYFED